jgi:hypothetical protein
VLFYQTTSVSVAVVLGINTKAKRPASVLLKLWELNLCGLEDLILVPKVFLVYIYISIIYIYIYIYIYITFKMYNIISFQLGILFIYRSV